MVLPALLVGAEAIRSNMLERRALGALGESMARTRTYAELETAMFDQSEIIWRYLSGLDPTAKQEFHLTGQVVDYWQQRWRGGASAGRDGARGRGRGHPAADLKPSRTACSRSSTPAIARPRYRWRSGSSRAGSCRHSPSSTGRSTAGPGSRACVAPTRRLEEILAARRARRWSHHRPRPGRGLLGVLAHLAEPRSPGQRADRGDGRGGLRATRSSDHAASRATRSAISRARSDA